MLTFLFLLRRAMELVMFVMTAVQFIIWHRFDNAVYSMAGLIALLVVGGIALLVWRWAGNHREIVENRRYPVTVRYSGPRSHLAA